MSRKRFTDADKWEDAWFRKLSPMAKLVWGYVTDRCDHAGIWKVDRDAAVFFIGAPIDWEGVTKELGNRLVTLSEGSKWYVPKFVTFQYGLAFNPAVRLHVSVMKVLRLHGLSWGCSNCAPVDESEGVSEGLPKGYLTPKDKDKDKDSFSLERDPRENPFPEGDDLSADAGPVSPETRTDRISSMGMFVRWKVSDESETKAAKIELDELIVERGKANVRRIAELIAKREGRKAYVNELSKEFLAADQVRSPPPPAHAPEPDTVRITRKPKPCPIPPKTLTTLSSAPSCPSSSTEDTPLAGPPSPT